MTDFAASRQMVTPTWVISPAACTTLCSTSAPDGGSTERDRSSRGGPLTASGRGVALVRGAVAFGFAFVVFAAAVAFGFGFAAALGAATRVRAAPPFAGFDAPEVAALVFAPAARGLAAARGFFAAVLVAFAAGSVPESPFSRRALRRWGRLRGRLVRTSVRSSSAGMKRHSVGNAARPAAPARFG